MNAPATGTCADCRFFDPFFDQTRFSLLAGVCRRFPPSSSGLAITDAHQWCGEFAVKDGAK
jgi:hypothetical protein